MSGYSFQKLLLLIRSGVLLLPFLLGSLSYAGVKFDRNEIGDLALVVASSQGLGVSSFGHAFLRIQKKAGTWSSTDYVIEIAAFNGTEDFSIFRGLGFISSYPARMSVLSYARMLDLKTREELRDLDNYVLDLKPEQKEKALAVIERLSDQENVGQYAFITQNCASFISDILSEAGIEYLHGITANVPSGMPGKLEELGYIKAKFKDRSAGRIRDLLLQKFPQPEITDEQIALIWPSIQKQLGSESMEDRVLGYLKLHYISRLDSSSQELKRQSKSLLRQFIMQESADFRTDLRKTFLEDAGAKSISVIPLFNKTLRMLDLRAVGKLKLEGDRNGAFVRVGNASTIAGPKAGPPADDRVPVPQLRFEMDQGLFYFLGTTQGDDKLVGAVFSNHVWEGRLFCSGRFVVL